MSLNQLLDVLADHPKCLVIDRQLSTAINSLIPFSQLKQKANIQSVYWFQDPLNVTVDTPITILIQSELSNVATLQSRVKELSAMNADVQIDVVITDDYERSFRYQLEQVGVLGEIASCQSWKLWIDTNGVMSLNLKQFEDLYLYKTSNSSFKLASLLNEHLKQNPQLRITKCFAKGLTSCKFIQIFKDLKENDVSQLSMQDKREFLKIEQGLYEQLSSGKQCDLIVLERNIDYLSVMLQQLSYSGIIDEVSGIDINTTKLDDNETVYLSLDEDSGVGIYESLKHMNFGLACDHLNSEAKALQAQYDILVKRVEVSSNLIGELQQLEFLKKEVSSHTKISEAILTKLGINENSSFNALLELQQDIIYQNIGYSTSITSCLDLIYQMFNIDDIFRLLCIISIVYGGLREKDFQNLSNEIIETYGIKYLLIIQNLCKIGVLVIRGDPPLVKSFNGLNSSMKLIPDDSNTNDLLAQTMVYRGYVPVMARVLDKTIKPDERASWKDVDLTSVMGKTLEESLIKEPKMGGGALQKDSTVFMVMIGGVTYSEVAAIRQWEEKFEKKHGVKKRVVVITDGYINAKELLASTAK